MKYFLIALLFLTPAAACAGSIMLTPESFSISPGERFSVAIRVEPAGATLYSASAQLSFDPALLRVEAFTLSPQWLPLAQPGYDLIDNEKGMLIKTAGYPGGISKATPLGSIAFTALQGGTAVISVSEDSLLLDASSTDRISGTQGRTSVAIAPKTTPHPAPSPAPIEKRVVEPVHPAVASSSLARSSLAAVSSAADPLPWSTFALVTAALLFIASVWFRYGKRTSDTGINPS